MAELDPYYSGSKSAVQTQLDAAPTQQEAELGGLDAKLSQANDNILAGARGRGLGFSGIPIAEQTKYAATEYAPAVANLKGKYVTQKNTLLEALNSLGRDQMGQAQGIFDNESQRELQAQQVAEQRRQFDQQMAYNKVKDAADRATARATAGGGSYSLGGGSAAAAPMAPAQALAQAFSKYSAAWGKQNPGFTEKVASALQQQYGISSKDALNMSYQYRKANFGV